jgi:hypothetical protein
MNTNPVSSLTSRSEATAYLVVSYPTTPIVCTSPKPFSPSPDWPNMGGIGVINWMFNLALNCPGQIYSLRNSVGTFYSIIGHCSNCLCSPKPTLVNLHWPNIDGGIDVVYLVFDPAPDCPGHIYSFKNRMDSLYSMIFNHFNCLYFLK